MRNREVSIDPLGADHIGCGDDDDERVTNARPSSTDGGDLLQSGRPSQQAILMAPPAFFSSSSFTQPANCDPVKCARDGSGSFAQPIRQVTGPSARMI
jgi:hypothetical protein